MSASIVNPRKEMSYHEIAPSVDSIDLTQPDYLPAVGAKYQFRKWFSIFVAGLSYLFVYFHRNTTAVLADQMSNDLNTPKTSLGILSSMYYWPYGLMQPFIGSLADIIEPGYMIGMANIIMAIGSLICGLSNSLVLCCFGRLLVGLGASSVFVPTNKIAANWFTAKQYRYFAGALIGLGGCGSLLSQKPLSMLGDVVGWRWCFLGVAVISFLTTFFAFFFVRGHPKTLHYYSDNPLPTKVPAKHLFIQLFANMKQMVLIPDFWYLAMFMFFAPGVFMDVISMWGVPFLEDVYGYGPQDSSFIAMSLSVAIVVGSPILPIISEKVKSRKWTLFAFAMLAGLISVLFALYYELNLASIIILYFLYGVGSSACQGAALALFKEFADFQLAATMVGGGNTGPFIGGAIFQTISSSIIGIWGANRKEYPKAAYSYGLWFISAICCFVASLSIVFVREPKSFSDQKLLESTNMLD